MCRSLGIIGYHWAVFACQVSSSFYRTTTLSEPPLFLPEHSGTPSQARSFPPANWNWSWAILNYLVWA